jgi:hypothetical protein
VCHAGQTLSNAGASCRASPKDIITELCKDAETASGTPAAETGYGFNGDANSEGGRYYGYLVHAGGY